MSGEPSSTIYRDLITEVTINQEIKVRGGQMMCGYSTSDRKMMNLLKQVMSWQKSDQSLKSRLICFDHAFTRSYHQDQEDVMTTLLKI